MSRLAQWNLPAYGGESLFDHHDEQPARLLFEGGYPTLDFSGLPASGGVGAVTCTTKKLLFVRRLVFEVLSTEIFSSPFSYSVPTRTHVTPPSLVAKLLPRPVSDTVARIPSSARIVTPSS